MHAAHVRLEHVLPIFPRLPGADTNCTVCTDTAAGDCTSCMVGFALTLGACQACSSHCDACTVSACTQCTAGTYFVVGGTCSTTVPTCSIGHYVTKPATSTSAVTCGACLLPIMWPGMLSPWQVMMPTARSAAAVLLGPAHSAPQAS